eukprot:TRINITY_DN2236_c0_g1_i1.p3 TRINITY_DN2236_c0_g1~~TRINITY_DN2236_c0_g1_i1.p3  ORF type:complete len:142 (+),score=22.58 TRINITY_DN2236_c0_g1_i1:612-1037(+)
MNSRFLWENSFFSFLSLPYNMHKLVICWQIYTEPKLAFFPNYYLNFPDKKVNPGWFDRILFWNNLQSKTITCKPVFYNSDNLYKFANRQPVYAYYKVEIKKKKMNSPIKNEPQQEESKVQNENIVEKSIFDNPISHIFVPK